MVAAKYRLLIVDSSESTRTILFKQILEQAPEIDVIVCASAREAITAARRFTFNVITTGTRLPDMDGHQLIDEIRLIPKNRHTDIFVISGDTETQVIDQKSSDERKISGYFNKSEGHKSLVTFILNHLASNSDNPIRVL